MKMYLSGFSCGVFWVFGRLGLGLDHHSSKHSEHTTADTPKVYFYFSPFNCCFVTCKRGLSWKSTHLVLSHYISILLTLKFYMFGSCLRTLAVILVSHLKKYFLVLSIKQPGRAQRYIGILCTWIPPFFLFFFNCWQYWKRQFYNLFNVCFHAADVLSITSTPAHIIPSPSCLLVPPQL